MERFLYEIRSNRTATVALIVGLIGVAIAHYVFGIM
jgi:hypothetical protein